MSIVQILRYDDDGEVRKFSRVLGDMTRFAVNKAGCFDQFNALYKLTESEPVDGNEPRGCVDQLTMAVHKNEPISAENKCQSSLGCLSLLDQFTYVI